MTLISSIIKNKLLLFLVKAFFFYLLWYLVYEMVLHPYTSIDALVIDNLVFLSSKLLQLLGYTLMQEPHWDENIRTLGIDGTHGVWIGDPCDGLTLFALFTGFVVAYPGPLKQKAWYIPLGIIWIHVLNIIRIASLCIVTLKTPEYLNFNHTYTFTLIVYGNVFLLWMWWANKFSKKEISESN